jgi:hypothetical protein
VVRSLFRDSEKFLHFCAVLGAYSPFDFLKKIKRVNDLDCGLLEYNSV